MLCEEPHGGAARQMSGGGTAGRAAQLAEQLGARPDAFNRFPKGAPKEDAFNRNLPKGERNGRAG
jgi:hypothetical protein